MRCPTCGSLPGFPCASLMVTTPLTFPLVQLHLDNGERLTYGYAVPPVFLFAFTNHPERTTS